MKLTLVVAVIGALLAIAPVYEARKQARDATSQPSPAPESSPILSPSPEMTTTADISARSSSKQKPYSKACKQYSYTKYVRVSSNKALYKALTHATPGTMIEVMPGRYWLSTGTGNGAYGTINPPKIIPSPSPSPSTDALAPSPSDNSTAPTPDQALAPAPLSDNSTNAANSPAPGDLPPAPGGNNTNTNSTSRAHLHLLSSIDSTPIPLSNTNDSIIPSAATIEDAVTAVTMYTMSARSGRGHGEFTVAGDGTIFNVHGKKNALITLCGSERAVFDGRVSHSRNTWRPFGLRVVHSSYIRISGFTLQNALKGLDVQRTSHSEFVNIHTRNTLQEGIRLRYNSTHNLVANNTVTETGKIWAGWGEGIYVGTSKKNSVHAGLPRDYTDNNAFISNRFGPGILAENIDVKEFTHNGIVMNNKFDGNSIQGINGAHSWVSFKGNNWTAIDNVGTGLHTVGAGFRVLVQYAGYGRHNKLLSNECYNLHSGSYCIYLQPGTTENLISCNNTVHYSSHGRKLSSRRSSRVAECNCNLRCAGRSVGEVGTVNSSGGVHLVNGVNVTAIAGTAINTIKSQSTTVPVAARIAARSADAQIINDSFNVPFLNIDNDDEGRPLWD